jgi:PhnB protein
MTTIHYVPSGHQVITPILTVTGADRLLRFLSDAFGATEYQVTRLPDSRIVHADVLIDGAHIMFAEAHGEPVVGAAVNLYVPDTDRAYERALAAGAASVAPPSDRFYGDRNAVVKDPTGVMWSLATHIEDVPPDELKRRESAFIRGMQG